MTRLVKFGLGLVVVLVIGVGFAASVMSAQPAHADPADPDDPVRMCALDDPVGSCPVIPGLWACSCDPQGCHYCGCDSGEPEVPGCI